VHSFAELVDHCNAFTLDALRQANERALDGLQTSAATPLVKALQMVQLQKAISAVGMFSLFEAMLQDGLECSDGFREAVEILEHEGETALKVVLRKLKEEDGPSVRLKIGPFFRQRFRTGCQ